MSAAGDRKQAAKGRRECRKAKSRDAARQRRGQESTVFDDVLAVLPLPDGCKEQLDKASIVRLTISCIKLRQLVRGVVLTDTGFSDASAPTATGHGTPVVTSSCPTSEVFNLLQCFLMLLSEAGDVVFVTENISKFIGTTQLDLTGNRIFDFLHPCDHDEVKATLHEKTGRRSFFFSRFRCVQQASGRGMPSKSAAYKVVKFTGHTLPGVTAAAKLNQASNGDETGPACEQRHLLLTGELIPNPSVEPLDELCDDNTFFSCHSLDMKFTACDAKAQQLVHYDVKTLIGSSLYEYVHGCDCRSMERFFKSLYSKGQSCTEPYRFLCSGGGYAWVVSKASVIVNRRSSAPQHVECIHTIVSGIEDAGCILSSVQCPPQAATLTSASRGSSPLGGRACRDDSSQCSNIVEDTEALFAELSCGSNTSSSSLPSPLSSDSFTDGIFSAAADASDVAADGKPCSAADDDIYTCTSGLFQDGIFGDATQTLILDDPIQGLLIDTSCLDEYLEEDMSQRAPYIPMNVASDEVFATNLPICLPTCTARRQDALQGALQGAGSDPEALPKLIFLPRQNTSFAGAWPGMQSASAQSLTCDPLPLLGSTMLDQHQRLPSTQPLWPAHLQPPISAMSGSNGVQVQHGWPYPAHNVLPPVAHRSVVHQVPGFIQGALPAVVEEPWELSPYIPETYSREADRRRHFSFGGKAVVSGREWASSCRDATRYLHAGVLGRGSVATDHTARRPGELGIGQCSTWPTACLLNQEDGTPHGALVSSAAPLAAERTGQARVKRLASCPQPDGPPRKRRALSVDCFSVHGWMEGANTTLASTASHERAAAKDLLHCSDIWHSVEQGTSRWTPLTESSRKSLTTEPSASDKPGAAIGLSRPLTFGLSRPLTFDGAASQLPIIGVEDLLFL